MTNKNSLKSIIILITYFMLPYLISLVQGLNLLKSIMCVTYLFILLVLYKDTFYKDLKQIKKEKKKSVMTIILTILSIIIVTILVNVFIEKVFHVSGTSENDYSLKNIFSKSPINLILLTTLYYPIVEGIVFRKAVRDIVTDKWMFIIFSSLFYFLFNIIYTSMSFNSIMTSICYFTTMMILSYSYVKSKNFTLSVFALMIYNLLFSVLNLI